MTWKDISLGKYQQIYPIILDEGTELDKLVRMISILTDRPEHEIDSEPLSYLNKFKFLFDLDFPKVVPKYIKVNGKRYKFIHDIKRMPAARYIETKTFLSDGGLIPNIHLVMASCVLPMKKTMFGWKVDKYDASRHSEYAQDMKDAPFSDTYNACVFFCLMFSVLIKGLETYLIREVKKVMNPEEAEAFTKIFPGISDGITQLSKLQN